MGKERNPLVSKLRSVSKRRGAVVLGITSVSEADSLKRIKIIDSDGARWSKKIADIMPNAESIIIFGIQAIDDFDELTVLRENGKWTYPGYDPLILISRDMVDILREMGYEATDIPESVTLKRIAVMTAIGSYGKNSMILSPKYGLSLRFGAVATNAEIEINHSFEKDLCGDCERCIRACPTKAIKPYVVESNKCLVHLMEIDTKKLGVKRLLEKYCHRITPNTQKMCTACQMVCPYTSDKRRKNVIRFRS